MMTADRILSVMVALQPPGMSPYSALPERPDVVCDTAYTDGCRRETEAEGIKRYWTIARAVAEVAADSPELAARMLTVIHAESGFRRDVHAGVGAHARGDEGRSCSLGQQNIGEHGRTGRGWSCAELVGTDIVSTRRAVATVAEGLLRGRAFCARVVGTADVACALCVYGGLPSLTRDRRIQARVRTYERVRKLWRASQEA